MTHKPANETRPVQAKTMARPATARSGYVAVVLVLLPLRPGHTGEARHSGHEKSRPEPVRAALAFLALPPLLRGGRGGGLGAANHEADGRPRRSPRGQFQDARVFLTASYWVVRGSPPRLTVLYSVARRPPPLAPPYQGGEREARRDKPSRQQAQNPARPNRPFHTPAPRSLTRDQASAFALLALKGLSKEYPNKLDHVMAAPADVKAPKALHPAFYGSYDWHSSVHGHWMLVRLLRVFPDLPESKEIRAVLGQHFTAEALKTEADYFARKESKPFERPYGWAWLLKLAEELSGWDDPDARTWSKNLRPLVDAVVARYIEFFPKQTYPIRTGVHPNTAFGLSFAHDYAVAAGDTALKRVIEERARSYFSEDADAPARWEPGGADFFSPTLTEADLMRRVLPPADFRGWFERFLPGAATGEPRSLFAPAIVTDRTDPQLVHLDGLNLSRAWAMRSIAAALPDEHPAGRALLASSSRHAKAALEHVASGDYAGEHWLASFAVYLLAPIRSAQSGDLQR